MTETLWPLFEAHLFDTPSTEEAFNPYRDRHPELDQPGAPEVRRANLRGYLDALQAPRLFMMAEAPGPWGCRFTGIPITSEDQLLDPAFPLSGQRTSTADDPHTEYSGSIFWRVMAPAFPHFFIWNSVPLHPHDAGDPLTIRTPRRTEVRAWSDLTQGLLDAMQPDRIVAIGRKAERAFNELEADPTYVRHPSHGGSKKFAAGMETILRDMDLPTASSA